MLISDKARNIHSELASRWDSLKAWMNDPQNVESASKVQPAIMVFYRHWLDVDKGILSDEDELFGVCLDIRSAERHATEYGYQAPESVSCTHPEDLAKERLATVSPMAPVVIAGAEKLEEYCRENPKASVCTVTDPKDLSWCQRAGALPSICDKEGLRPWFLWTLGGVGVAILGGIAYASYKAAQAAAPYAVPLAMARYAPAALPVYQQIRAERATERAAERATERRGRER